PAPAPATATPASAPVAAAVPAAPAEEEVLNSKQAAAAIQASDKRSDVAHALTAFMRGRFGGGLLKVVKGDLALGHMGCGGTFDARSVESIIVPLAAPSMFQRSFLSKETFRGPPPVEGKGLQDRFFKNFPLKEPPEEVLIVPVVLG